MRKVLKMTWPNMALTNMGLKTKNWSHLEKDQNIEREGKSKRREEEEKEEEEDGGAKRYGTNLGYGFYYGSYGFCMGL